MIKQIKVQYTAEQLLSSSEYEDNVHHRQKKIDKWTQSKLKNTKVGIVGAGGLGGNTAINLAREGCGRIVVCDADNIELSNLNRQPYYKEQIKKNKAIELGKNLLRECTDATTICSIALPFQKTIEEYPDVFYDSNIILCLVDNNITRFDVAKYGLRYNIPIIMCGVSVDAKNGYVFVQKDDNGCFNCLWNMDDKIEEKNECGLPSAIYIHKIMSGIVSYVTTGLIMDWTIPWTYFEIGLDGYSRSIDKIKKIENCKLCSN